MAAASQIIYSSPIEGSTVTINYDDVTLHGSVAITTPSGDRTLTWSVFQPSGQQTGTVSPAAAAAHIGPPSGVNPPGLSMIQGVAGTDPRGGSTIHWGIEPYGITFT